MISIQKMLLHEFLLFLMAGGIAGFFVGALLLLRPVWLLNIGRKVNRWVVTRHIGLLLDRVVKVDRWFYRHHRASGASLLAGAAFLMYFFVAVLDKPHLLMRLSAAWTLSPAIAEILLDATVLAILLGAAFTAIVSLFLLVRPSMLRELEQHSNQWISLRRALKPFEISRAGVDDYVFLNVQMAGVLLLFCSLYTLIGLTHWL
jgi:hypothetical protein